MPIATANPILTLDLTPAVNSLSPISGFSIFDGINEIIGGTTDITLQFAVRQLH